MSGRPVLPMLHDLGPDLLAITPTRRWLSLALPFFWFASYFAFASLGWWPAAVASVIALSFVTYGSVSHDLVHRSLGLPRWLNSVLLSMIELLALRSGHAYQASHLHHHARFPAADDVEAAVACRGLAWALADGLVAQYRIWFWALGHAAGKRVWIIVEGIACLCLAGLAVGLLPWTGIPLVYVLLVIMGSWIIPLVTSYLPHNPHGKNELFQTRAFRGRVASLVALDHLYHLEHHLYPAVPHHNWPCLAKRLEPCLLQAGVKLVKLGF